MSLNSKLVAFSQAVGVDVGELIMTRGVMSDLTTVQKGNLVAAINELKVGLASIDLTAIINDLAEAGVLNQTWSADKITMRLNQLKVDVLNGAPDSMNTLKEISDYLASNTQNVNDILLSLSGTVRYDASQELLVGQQLQACVNIGVGDPEVDLIAFLHPANPIVVGGNYELLTGSKGETHISIIADNSSLTIDMSTIQGVSPASVPASVGYLGVAVNINSITTLSVIPNSVSSDIYVTDITIMSGPAGTSGGALADALTNNTALIFGNTHDLYFDYTDQDRRAKITFSVSGNLYTVELFIAGV